MTRKTFLIIDSDYLCHAAFYKIGVDNNGVILGFLTTVLRLHRQFKTRRLLFCFDSPTSKRKIIYPQYKANRHKFKTEKEVKDYQKYCKQVLILRKHILPALGYTNIFYQEGHEADDLIACIAKSIKPPHKGIIISTDKDLYQCLRQNRVYMYNLRTSEWFAFESFRKMYGIYPYDWAFVKAIAGCSSDNIQGIKGVGEKTAIKALRGVLPESSVYSKRIIEFVRGYPKEYGKMVRLVQLPYPGSKLNHALRKPRTTSRTWLCELTRRRNILRPLSETVKEYKQYLDIEN